MPLPAHLIDRPLPPATGPRGPMTITATDFAQLMQSPNFAHNAPMPQPAPSILSMLSPSGPAVAGNPMQKLPYIPSEDTGGLQTLPYNPAADGEPKMQMLGNAGPSAIPTAASPQAELFRKRMPPGSPLPNYSGGLPSQSRLETFPTDLPGGGPPPPTIRELLLGANEATSRVNDRLMPGDKNLGIEPGNPAGQSAASDAYRQRELYQNPAYQDLIGAARAQKDALAAGVEPGYGSRQKMLSLPHVKVHGAADPNEPNPKRDAMRGRIADRKAGARDLIQKRAMASGDLRRERLQPGTFAMKQHQSLENLLAGGAGPAEKERALRGMGRNAEADVFKNQQNNDAEMARAKVFATGQALSSGNVDPRVANAVIGGGAGGSSDVDAALRQADKENRAFGIEQTVRDAPDAETAIQKLEAIGAVDEAWPAIQQKFPDAIHPNAPSLPGQIYNSMPGWAQNLAGWGASGMFLGPGAFSVIPGAIGDLLTGQQSNPLKWGGAMKESLDAKRRQYKPSGPAAVIGDQN